MNTNQYNAPPYNDIAKEFLDIWQKQITSVVGDKQFIQATLEMFQQMQKKNHANTTASNTAATSDTRDDMLAQLAFRLAMCEKRIAALEGKKSRASRAKPAQRKTAKRS
jgi:hypothetical protein